MPNKNNLFAVFNVLFILFVWSFTFTEITIALQEFSPGGLALFRFSIASIVLVLLSFKQKIRIPSKTDIPILILSGFIGITIYHLLIMYGQIHCTAGVASLLISTYPIFLAIFSSFIYKELINVNKWIGILMCFLGISLVSLGENNGILIGSSTLLLLCAAIVLSLFDLNQKNLMKKYTPFELTCYFIWSGTLFLFIFTPDLIREFQLASIKSIFAGFYLGIFPSAIVYVLWAKLLSKFSASTLSLVCYISPFFAMLVAFLSINQVPSSLAMYGSLVVFLGIVFMTFAHKLSTIKPKIYYLAKNKFCIKSYDFFDLKNRKNLKVIK